MSKGKSAAIEKNAIVLLKIIATESKFCGFVVTTISNLKSFKNKIFKEMCVNSQGKEEK